ncbi:MAG: rod shape-determining protein MreC [Candidatus Kerfeldbacteria bacterium]|nr:rod shape-determining protein MreC [Candidatus Kerfeldbacteria bacterium]
MPPTLSLPRTLVTTTMVVAVVIVAHYLGLLRSLETFVLRAFQPIGRLIVSRAVDNTRSTVPTAELNQWIRQLEEQNAALSKENVQLKATLAATVEASVQAKFLREHKLRGVAGRIFSRSPNPAAEFIVIDIGTEDNVRVGAPAITSDGIVVGRVIETDRLTSKVLLSIDNRSSFAGMVIDNPAAQGEVSGVRGLSLRMDLIPQSERLQPGQLVVTSGVDPTVEPKLLLGAIQRVDKQEGSILQSASLRPLYNPARLEAVTVLTAS